MLLLALAPGRIFLHAQLLLSAIIQKHRVRYSLSVDSTVDRQRDEEKAYLHCHHLAYAAGCQEHRMATARSI